MAEVQGVVERIATKQTAKGGTITNIQVNGEWYGMGFAKVNFGQGAEVEFDISWNGNYANVDGDTLNILSPGQRGGGNGGGQRNGGGGYGGQRNGNGGGGNYGGQRGGGQQQRSAPPRQAAGSDAKDEYWKKKEKTDKLTQRVIQHQSARNSAIAFLDVLFKNEAVKLPAKQSDKFDAALALLDELTAKFIEATRGYALGSATTQQAAPQARQVPPPEPEPEPEPQQFDDDLPQQRAPAQGYGNAGDPQDFDDDIPF